jgi:hypothetical protein
MKMQPIFQLLNLKHLAAIFTADNYPNRAHNREKRLKPSPRRKTAMTETIETIPAPVEADKTATVPENPAIARCLSALIRAYKEGKAKNQSDYESSDLAHRAYRKAMPRLSGYDNIRDFIACVAHGMLIGAIDGDDGTRLLYAAQVALGTVHRQPPAPKPA